MNNLTVLVLAGGEGKRFSPFTTNKILFPFFGKALIEYSVKRVLPKETSQLIFVTSTANDEIIRNTTFSVPVKTVVQSSAKGMADAILTAKEVLPNGPVLILIADDLFDENLPQLVVQTAERTNAFAVIPGWKVEKYFPGGYLITDENRITGIVEKPVIGKEPSNVVNISGHFYRDGSSLISALEKIDSQLDDRYEQALETLMKEQTFIVHPYSGAFASLKYPWHVIDCMDMLLTSITSFKGDGCDLRQNVIIEGPVFIGNNVKIFENTKIVGPVYIGDNTIIGNNNVIRHSMIGANCVTGFNTDITRSYIGDSCWFHSNYIGDSVLEQNISMGSGSVLANLRLDEGNIFSKVNNQKIDAMRNKLGAMIGKNVRIGVNSSIMPGIKIGQETMIGAGITVSQDIPEFSFVTAKTELIIESNRKKISTDREEFKKKL